mgnify:CR=1 FL=1
MVSIETGLWGAAARVGQLEVGVSALDVSALGVSVLGGAVFSVSLLAAALGLVSSAEDRRVASG